MFSCILLRTTRPDGLIYIQRTAQPLSITTTQPKLSHTNKQSCCSAHPSLSTPSTRRTSCTWIVLLVLIGAMRFLYQQHNRCNHFLLSHCFLACQWSRSPPQPPMFFNKAASPHIVVPRKIMRNSSLLLLALPFRSCEETMGNKRATWSRWNLVHLANKIKISKHCYYSSVVLLLMHVLSDNEEQYEYMVRAAYTSWNQDNESLYNRSHSSIDEGLLWGS